jgi:two-component system LytT family response regulator
LRIVIVDDQKRICTTIKSLIRIHYPKAEVIGEAYNAAAAYELIKAENPDVVLLDIKMPKESGFDLLKKLRPINFKLIFITAYHEYAVKAFRFAALDYLMKPIEPPELIEALHKAKQQIQLDELNTKVDHLISNFTQTDSSPKKIVIRAKNALKLIEINNIIRCEADDRYTTFFMNDGKHFVSSETLKTYDEMLSAIGFFRCHNSHLINKAHIVSFEKKDGGVLVMRDNSAVPVAVRKKEEMIRMLENL